MTILGITGTFGAGKGTVVEYLKEKGFVHFSASGFITEEVKRRGLVVNRDSMSTVANDLRAKHSPSYIVEQLYERAAAQGQDSIIESLHTIAEAQALKGIGKTKTSRAFIIAVDADLGVRYDRIKIRASEKDHVSFETFEKQERLEIASLDPTMQNIAGVMALADFTIQNNGTLEELHEQVDGLLKSISRC